MKSILFIISAMIFAVNVTFAGNELTEAFKKSYEQEKSGNYTGAIQTLRTNYAEDSYEINLRLGWLHYMSGLFTESGTYYAKAIKIQPSSIEARLGAVNPEASLGNWDKVIKHYEEILDIDPNHSITNYRLGSILYGRGKYEEAYKMFEKVVNMYPFDSSALLMYGWTNFKLGKTGQAKVLFEKVLLAIPDNKSALEGLELAK